ncbi:hypothetical protein LOK49_LG06G00642 [Camellia lanceoleosa]|uniref:Uncharacterized protein n=1 Tax=Camellia lanceoleosa TaxID=1840588 RepID=A0ACC0HIS9_9ERIC|nr:hypothetical protein LOK49_LG06G00642 [Camellia lanceoleosa]
MDCVKKNRGRSKLWLCLRPIAIEEEEEGKKSPGRTEGTGDPDLAYITVDKGQEKKMVIPKILTSLSEAKLNVSSCLGGGGGRRNNERSRRSLSRVIKAVFFETSLAKKVRSSRKDSAKTKKVSKSANEKLRESSESSNSSMNYNRSFSVTSSAPFCSSSSASSTLNSRSSSERKESFLASQVESKPQASPVESKQVDRSISTKKVVENYSSNMVMLLLLLCLLVLILWGKVCAIVCTSTCFFLVPNNVKRVGSTIKNVQSSEIESEEHKKRVVMQGLLERNCNRGAIIK